MGRIVSFLLCLLFFSCNGGSSAGYDYKVALDPAWHSLEVPGRATNLTAFTLELIEAIGKDQGVKIAIYQRSWNNLMMGLQEHDYDAICSPMQPYLFYEKMYDFSDLFLMTGPVLVVPASNMANSLEELSGKEIGIQRTSNAALILEKYPVVIERSYDSIPQALNDVRNGIIDGAIVNLLAAQAFIGDLYQGQLRIATPPLSDEGLRLIAQHGQSPQLMKTFNRGLKRLQDDGTYASLAKKWGLIY